MIRTIARKEILEIRRDGRFLWTSLVIVALLLIAMGVGAQRYTADRNLREEAFKEDRASWLNQGSKGPHTAGHYGVYAFKPATPLALFDPGINDYTGTLQYLEAHKENQASFKPAADATALARFGDLSGAMVLQMLVPLLIILLCFGMISGEREDGTFRQLMSMGISRTQLVWGKAVGVAGAISMVLIPAIIVGVIGAAFVAGGNDQHEMVDFDLKLVLIVLAYCVFFAIYISIALLVSIHARSSSAALTSLVGFWIVTSLLIPRIGTDVSKAIYPTPTSLEVADQIQKGRDKGTHAHEPNHPNHIAFKKKILEQYGVTRIEDLPLSFTGLALQADEELGFKVFDSTYGRIRELYVEQDKVHQVVSVLSPFVAIKRLSAALSGTDVDFANDFSRGSEDYRRNMVKILNLDIMKNATGVTQYSAEWGYRANKSLWSQVPPFDYDPPEIGVILQRNIIPILVLLGWLAGSVALLSHSAKRVRPDR